jgi:hypothetical protein
VLHAQRGVFFDVLLFARSNAGLSAPLTSAPLSAAMTNKTEEGQKVTRLSGSKYPAVFRRVKDRTLGKA